MDRARSRGRYFTASGIVLAWMLAWCPGAFALDPALDVSQYAHTAWKVREGFAKGAITSIAQTPDGYLWLGTEFGLLRFDGIRNVPWQPPPDQTLPSNTITRLLVTRDGTLWIGTFKGLASWKDGKLTKYPELAGNYILGLLEDREGTLWAGGGGGPTGNLCAIHDGTVRSYGEDGSFGREVISLYEDSKGNLWAGAQNGLWRWKPGPPQFYPLPEPIAVLDNLGEGADGTLLIGTRSGIQRFVTEKTEAYPLTRAVGEFRPRSLLRDRDGGLWIGTADRGLVHVHQGRADVFAQSDSLSGDWVYALFEDREGTIWVATANGLDRFRDFAVATFSAKQGVSNTTLGSVLAARDGSVWLATSEGLNRWNNGQITIPATGSSNRDGKFNGLIPHSLFQDSRGRIWVSTGRDLGYLENDRFTNIRGIPSGNVWSIIEDTPGAMWIADMDHSLIQLLDTDNIQRIPWDKLGQKGPAGALAADPLKGGLWLGFYQGGVAYYADGQIRASYGLADGLGAGRVNLLRIDQDGTLWVATEGGLSRLKNGRVATLSSKNGLPCDAVHWVIEDDAHSFWLYMTCGMVRVARTELDAWAAALEQDKGVRQIIQTTVFDGSDGVGMRSMANGYGPQVTKASDGRLWFAVGDGVSVINPRRLPFNKLPPPVHIEQITADHKTYDVTSPANGRLTLPALLRDLEIDYTALSLVASEKVRFRFKLEPRDREWRDATPRRQASYNDLPPGNYRFRVMACNNSGVWNETGAFLDFSVAPAYYQTWWFFVSCGVAFLALLAAAYQFRLRQVAQQFNLRMEERVAERTRIARDFHDTLLQSFQGVVLKFYAVTKMLPDRPEARQKLEGVIDQAEQAITEGRDAVQGLRASTVVTNELARAISTLGEQLSAEQTGHNPPGFFVIAVGTSRELIPLVRDEIYRIASEALRNAFRHAEAKRIEVEIQYEKRQFRLWVRDDGKGLDQKVADDGGREGHYGMAGMRERARLVGGKLMIYSGLNSGTDIELMIPASLVYGKSSAARWSLFSRKRM